MELIEAVVLAVRAQQPVVLPFDTVYGLAADPYHEQATSRLYELKGRDESRPSALVAASVDYLLECVPELRRHIDSPARALLPGPVTLILQNPAQRFRWLTGPNPDAIGVRVPRLEGLAAEALQRLGAVVATSANHPGGPNPRQLDEVPENILSGAGAVLDGGELPGTPSTVVDLTGAEPRIVREGALRADEVLERLAAAVRSS